MRKALRDNGGEQAEDTLALSGRLQTTATRRLIRRLVVLACDEHADLAVLVLGADTPPAELAFMCAQRMPKPLCMPRRMCANRAHNIAEVRATALTIDPMPSCDRSSDSE